LARALCNKEFTFDASGSLHETISQLRAIDGIGEEMAHYIAMRALGEPDAFPLEEALITHLGPDEIRTSGRALSMAEGWRPWRAYAAMHLWADSAAL
jgi:3-methyladenine DNA glycosylase/8-oxoguanine DNA glycosylase